VNTSTYRYAILFVGATLLLSVVGIVLLSFGDFGSGRPIPDVLQNIAIGSLTGLVGLLVQPGERDLPLLKRKGEGGYGAIELVVGVILVVILLVVLLRLL
jgi:hypothetical protein